MAKHNYYDATNQMITEVDLCNLIGVPVPNDLRSLISDQTPLNMFAKYKPVKRALVNGKRQADFWKANDGDCGIKIDSLTYLSQIGIANWRYDPPRGGVSDTEPNVLSDFYYYGKYNKNAEPPVTSGHKSAIIHNKFNNADLVLSLRSQIGGESSRGIGISDIAGIQDMYAAVSLGTEPSDNTTQTAIATISKIGGDRVIFNKKDINKIPNGFYNLYYYLRSSPRNYPDPASAANTKPMFHGLGYLNPVPIQLISVFPATGKITGVSPGKLVFQPLPKTEGTAISNINGTLYFALSVTTTNDYVNIQPGQLKAKVNGYYGRQEVGVGLDAAINQPPNSSKSYVVSVNFSTQNGIEMPPPVDRLVLEASFDIYFIAQNVEILIAGEWFFMKNY